MEFDQPIQPFINKLIFYRDPYNHCVLNTMEEYITFWTTFLPNCFSTSDPSKKAVEADFDI